MIFKKRSKDLNSLTDKQIQKMFDDAQEKEEHDKLLETTENLHNVLYCLLQKSNEYYTKEYAFVTPNRVLIRISFNIKSNPKPHSNTNDILDLVGLNVQSYDLSSSDFIQADLKNITRIELFKLVKFNPLLADQILVVLRKVYGIDLAKHITPVFKHNTIQVN